MAWPIGFAFLMVTVGFGLTGGMGKPCSLSSATCSSMPSFALDRQSSMERPVPVNPSRSGEKNPKNVGSSVASMTNEYLRSITLRLLASQAGRFQDGLAGPTRNFLGSMIIDSNQAVQPRL